jgi:type IV pilus assembly protein PilY1
VDYAPDSIVMFNNLYWQTTAGGTSNGITGPSDDTGVTWTVKNDVYTDAVGDWNGATSYVSGNIVKYDNKFYKALSDNSNIPTSPTGTWKEVSGPVYASCQSNNLIIITEGSSTADLNQKMLNFVSTNNDADADGSTDLEGQCDSLQGSTYFDDLTYYGLHATDLYGIEPFGDHGGGAGLKSTIQTYKRG